MVSQLFVTNTGRLCCRYALKQAVCVRLGTRCSSLSCAVTLLHDLLDVQSDTASLFSAA